MNVKTMVEKVWNGFKRDHNFFWEIRKNPLALGYELIVTRPDDRRIALVSIAFEAPRNKFKKAVKKTFKALLPK